MNDFAVGCWVLLQSGPAPAPRVPRTGDMIRDWAVWFAVIVVVMVFTLVLLKRAKKLVVSEPRPIVGFSFDLDQLRELRDTGEITIQEYEKLRKQAIEKALQKKGQGESTEPPRPGQDVPPVGTK
ncbi:MAG: hypothetical protein IT449_05545 [Phycisphaerales bacterium]|nr:hypothetical protein [Phycisphaerales bacterium]